MKRKVIPWKYFPMRIPWGTPAVLYLLLKMHNAPGWLWGVAGTITVLGFVVWGLHIATTQASEPWIKEDE